MIVKKNIRVDNLVDINSDRHVINMDRDCQQVTKCVLIIATFDLVEQGGGGKGLEQ